jgi:hypothetical protein
VKQHPFQHPPRTLAKTNAAKAAAKNVVSAVNAPNEVAAMAAAADVVVAVNAMVNVALSAVRDVTNPAASAALKAAQNAHRAKPARKGVNHVSHVKFVNHANHVNHASRANPAMKLAVVLTALRPDQKVAAKAVATAIAAIGVTAVTAQNVASAAAPRVMRLRKSWHWPIRLRWPQPTVATSAPRKLDAKNVSHANRVRVARPAVTVAVSAVAVATNAVKTPLRLTAARPAWQKKVSVQRPTSVMTARRRPLQAPSQARNRTSIQMARRNAHHANAAAVIVMAVIAANAVTAQNVLRLPRIKPQKVATQTISPVTSQRQRRFRPTCCQASSSHRQRRVRHP